MNTNIEELPGTSATRAPAHAEIRMLKDSAGARQCEREDGRQLRDQIGSYTPDVPRMTVKLLLLDEQDRVLLIRSSDPRSGAQCWYPVGGGVETGESLQQAALREAHEETGLSRLPVGAPVWTREHTYEYDGRTVEVHEDWLLHKVRHFEPSPAGLSEFEAKTIAGFRWWEVEHLSQTTDTIFPPRLGDLLSALLRDGLPQEPVDISEPFYA